ncbi:hypothetical protein OC861_002998 [Tilletia horrida]|nr:hypothetical protein OC861_002998 [Tilletia horrida]
MIVSAVPHNIYAHGDMCGVLQDASLLNLDLLGCPHIGIGGRELLHAPSPRRLDRATVCAALEAADLSNLETLGCGQSTVRGRGDGNEWEAELCAHPSNPCGHWPAPNPSPKPWPQPHPKPWPQPHPQPPHPPSGGGGGGGRCHQSAPKCSTEELCEVIQHGLINIDILGCAKIDAGGHVTAPAPPCCEGCNACDHDEACKVQACKILQQGGLLNLDLLGCAGVHL